MASAMSGAMDHGDAASMASAAYTYATATTFRTKASQPDYVRMPSEYEKVGEEELGVERMLGKVRGAA
jgi:hypothetical protein